MDRRSSNDVKVDILVVCQQPCFVSYIAETINSNHSTIKEYVVELVLKGLLQQNFIFDSEKYGLKRKHRPFYVVTKKGLVVVQEYLEFKNSNCFNVLNGNVEVVEDETKVCKKCLVEKPVSEFYISRSRVTRRNKCKDCMNEEASQRRSQKKPIVCE